MRKWILTFFLVISLLLPVAASAQSPVTFSSLQIQIWPEYDKPGVLVIYQITLSSSTAYPVTLSFRIPSSAGEPNAVAARQVDGTLYTMDYTRQVAGEWAIITFTTTAPDVQLEYYDPGLVIEGDSHHFEYLWPGDYAASELVMQVQQPAGATDMVISPSLGGGTTGSDNLTYYTQNIGSITAGQTISITIDYQKSDSALSVENIPIQPSAPIPDSATPDLTTWLPWILGILGAGLIIGGIVWFWQSGRQKPSTKNRRSRGRSTSGEQDAASTTTETGVYCSQCGKRASEGDVYCRYCGTQIRNK